MNKDRMKVLYMDIEATNLSASMGYILCIGYKWAHESRPKIIRIDHTKEYKKKPTDDTGVLKAFEEVYNQADYVVYHFGEFYDVPFVQTRRAIKGLKPLTKVTGIDTWRIAKKRLKFHSNRLEVILETLGCPYKKTSLKGGMWIDAMAGIPKAIDYVVEHCYQDVLALEWVYNKIKPFWDLHPRAVLAKDDRYCSLCEKSTGVSKGQRACARKVYTRVVCTQCGFNWKGKVISDGRN